MEKSIVTPAEIKNLLSSKRYEDICRLLEKNDLLKHNYYGFIYSLAQSKIQNSVSKHISSSNHLDNPTTLDVSKFTSECILCFIGRFRSVTGYGKATRDFFDSLFNNKPANVSVIGIDSQNLNCIGDINAIESLVLSPEKHLKIKPAKKDSILHLIIHETPNKFSEIKPQGRCTVSAWTIHEDISMIFGKENQLTIPQHLYVASNWNKELLLKLGFADDYITVIPHVAPPAIHQSVLSDKGKSATISYLAVMSNQERKNIRSLISGFIYAKEFYQIDIKLTLKLPVGLNPEIIKHKVLPYNIKSLDELPSYINVVSTRLTDAEMMHLICTSDCLINVESIKGFDLDSLFALSIGKQCISTLSGGNVEYQNDDNSYVVPSLLPEYFNAFNYSNPNHYSAIVSHTPNICDIADQVREVFEDLKKGIFKNNPESALAIRTRFSSKSIASLFYKNLCNRNHDYDLLSLLPAQVELALGKDLILSNKFKCDSLSDDEVESFHSRLKYPNDFASKLDWVTDRRKFIGAISSLPPLLSEKNRLLALKNKYPGKRCFVIGNGPSLNKTDLSKLENEFTFIANKFYLKLPDISWSPSFYTCLDWTVTPDDSENIQSFFDKHPQILKFIPTRFKYLFKEESNVFYYHSKPSGFPLTEKFEIDALRGIRGGGTVATAMIQLAAFMGFRDIYLIGTDVSYKVPKTVVQSGPDKFKTGTKLYLESTADDDPNHFCSNYFGKGAKWHDPNVPEMKRGFRNAYLGAKLYGINIFNATVGGELNQIPRCSYEDLFKI